MKKLTKGILISSSFSFFIVIVLSVVNIPVNVILPTTAPIWAGVASLVVMTS